MTHAAFETTFTALGRDELMVLDDAEDVTLAVDAGLVWVTLHHDTRDVFVAAGERFRIDRPGRTVVTAHAPASLRLLRPLRFARLRTVGAALARVARRLLPEARPRALPYL